MIPTKGVKTHADNSSGLHYWCHFAVLFDQGNSGRVQGWDGVICSAHLSLNRRLHFSALYTLIGSPGKSNSTQLYMIQDLLALILFYKPQPPDDTVC